MKIQLYQLWSKSMQAKIKALPPPKVQFSKSLGKNVQSLIKFTLFDLN